jgi:ubiquinone/menaquinone biosynthesis C-methylase UbiE
VSAGIPISGQQLNSAMDHCANSASTFHKLADRYRDKYMDLTLYDDSYREFCERLRQGRARVLDAACGPGNVSRYLIVRAPSPSAAVKATTDLIVIAER